MRLDKYLKVSRLVKRRTVAKVVVSDEKIMVNGKIVKPSHEIKQGDIIVLSLGKHLLTIKVLEIYNVASVENAQKMYQIISDQIVEEI
jgi:ribosomal 50S subunit-recycling heat shock protein